MFRHISEINLEELKRNHVRLYYFGLGFIQLKIDETYRLHFYSDKLPAITEDIHNHRYDFTSTILQGRFTNNHWYIADKIPEMDKPTHVIVNESCNPEISAPALNLECFAKHSVSKIYGPGDSYFMSDDRFHTVSSEDNCVTLLKRGDYTKEFAQIVLPKNKESVCPFSKKIPEDELWKLMAEMLNCT